MHQRQPDMHHTPPDLTRHASDTTRHALDTNRHHQTCIGDHQTPPDMHQTPPDITRHAPDTTILEPLAFQKIAHVGSFQYFVFVFVLVDKGYEPKGIAPNIH